MISSGCRGFDTMKKFMHKEEIGNLGMKEQ